jgi:restriction system protein
MSQFNEDRKGQLQQALLRALQDAPDGLRAKDVLERLAQTLTLTEYEKADYPSHPGVRRFERLIRFSSIPLVKAGWLAKSKGVWLVTKEGREALTKFPDPAEFRRASVAKYHEWAAGNKPDEDEIEVEAEPSKANAVVTLEEAEENAWSEILEHLATISPFDFQDLVSGLLSGMGYHIAFISPPGPDRGIDIVAHTDPLGVQGPRIKVQVKRRADKINVEGIRSFMALLGDGDVGIFVSVGGFTSEAEREARAQERRRIRLVDAKALFDLWVQHYSKIPDEQRRLMPLKPIHYLDLES